MNLIGKGAWLTLATLTIFVSSACAEVAAGPGGSPTTVQNNPKLESPLVPADFHVPTLVAASDFKIVPLGPELAKIDFAAYMSSIDHLQKTFTRSTAWPHKDISDADAMRDMESEEKRFRDRTSFAYAVVTPDGKRERGCVYIYPSDVAGYDAVVRMWVTQTEYVAGFDAELYEWVVNWIRKDWPFLKVAYPGRAIDWSTWDALVAANTAKIAHPEPPKH